MAGYLKDLKRWGGGGEGTSHKFGWGEPLRHKKKPLHGTRPGHSNLATQLFKKHVIPFLCNSYIKTQPFIEYVE